MFSFYDLKTSKEFNRKEQAPSITRIRRGTFDRHTRTYWRVFLLLNMTSVVRGYQRLT